MKHIKLTPISLKNHPVLDERWVQEVIAADPAILGLGDVSLRDRERIQSSGGRLDLLLVETETKSRYEVEIQLGPTDPSHIIRTIEYWDNEKKRYPNLLHTAVIVAEDITSRFLNVISLFNRAIPIIAIQMKAIETKEGVSLLFTKVLDTVERGLEDEDEEINEPADRAYWEAKASLKTMKMADKVMELCRGFTTDLDLSYNKHYIGFRVEGKPCNFITCKPQKSAMQLTISLPKTSEVDALLESSEMDLLEYDARGRRYRLRLSPEDVTKHSEFLIPLLKQAYDRRNAE